MSTQPTPIINGDVNRDSTHDVSLATLYDAEALLVSQGSTSPVFRIATFTDAPPGNPEFDVPFAEFSIPSESGTPDLQLMAKLLVMNHPFTYQGQSYDSVRAGAPTAIQYSVDQGKTWLWVSDLMAGS